MNDWSDPCPVDRTLDLLMAEGVMRWSITSHSPRAHDHTAAFDKILKTGAPFPAISYNPADKGPLSLWRDLGVWNVGHIWSPSANITDAWEVVEKLRKKLDVSVASTVPSIDFGLWQCQVSWAGKNPYGWIGKADTAALAICYAAREYAKRELP